MSRISRLLIVALLNYLSSFCKGLKVPGAVQDIFKNLPSPNEPKNVAPTPKDPTTAALERLNITKSIEPKPFSARAQFLPQLALASFPAVLRLGSGVFGNQYGFGFTRKRPEYYTIGSIDDWQTEETMVKGRLEQREPLVIYEFEGCPFCRRVREAVSILGLTVTFLPCPKNGRRYRIPIKDQYGEQATFPFLNDPNTGASMFESSDIVTYLFKTYGTGEVPKQLLDGSAPLLGGIGLILAGGRGNSWRASNPPPLPVTLWAYEGSPFCKVVRNVLCELEIPHTQMSTPRGSPNRQRMFEETGRFQVPYLVDPNTGVTLWESEVIVEYLEKEYGVPESPIKYL